MPEQSDRHLAMLIDGDNAQYSLLKLMLEEASRYGTVIIRRAYGDWTTPYLANWRPVMLAHAIQPIQQFAYTTGKNATDSALIIDAMDILHAKTVQGFCIASSDSDYTRLCTRIRESGLFVMGIGHKRTPEAFRNACDVFVYVENLIPPDEISLPVEAVVPVAPVEVVVPVENPPSAQQTSQPKKTAAPATPSASTKKATPTKKAAVPAAPAKKAAQPKKATASAATKKVEPEKTIGNNAALLNLLQRAFDISEQDDGWVHLGSLGQALHRLDPSFDSRTYGHKTLSLLVKSLPKQLVIKGSTETGPSEIYVRRK